MLLSDVRIAELAEAGMIRPFVPAQVREVPNDPPQRVVSYGLSCFGYDLRLDREDIWVSRKFGMLKSLWRRASGSPLEISPKHFPIAELMQPVEPRVDSTGSYALIPPRGFCLCRSMEYLCIPPAITGLVFAKSTLSRSGLMGLMTPAEAGWEGHYVFEFFNPWDRPYRLYTGEGVAQILFAEGYPALLPYNLRKDPKYQGQRFVGPKL